VITAGQLPLRGDGFGDALLSRLGDATGDTCPGGRMGGTVTTADCRGDGGAADDDRGDGLRGDWPGEWPGEYRGDNERLALPP